MTASRRQLRAPLADAPFSMLSALAVVAAITVALTLGCVSTAARATETNASGWTLDRLMSTLAQSKSRHATFVETKYLAIAAKPVESSGELVFVAPDHLEKHTISPKPENLVVDGDMLTVESNHRKVTLALANYPQLSAFIESIRATLAGNRYALEQVYKVTVAGHGDDWTMTLKPLDSRMLKTVSAITLEGKRDMLQSVAIQQPDGDHSLMRLQPASAN